MSHFKVEELTKIAFENATAHLLPEHVKNILIELEELLEIPEHPEISERKESSHLDKFRHTFGSSEHSTSSVNRNRYDIEYAVSSREKDKKKRDFKQKEARNETTTIDKEWESMRSFKATKMESKTGIEKTVNDVRIALNKISATNYDKQRDVVFGLVDNYFNSAEEQTPPNTRRISKSIFDIASTNKFYSEIYAKLYKELSDKYEVFRDLLNELIDGFIKMESIPEYVDPDLDYDGFCEYSKLCDIRKSISTFTVNCAKIGLMSYERLIYVLQEFVNYVDLKRTSVENSKCIEEVVENIHIIATLCISDISKSPKWNENVLSKIKIIVEERHNQPGMSNRCAFKLIDLLEKL